MRSSKIIFKDLESVKSYAESFSLWLEVLWAVLFLRGSGKVSENRVSRWKEE